MSEPGEPRPEYQLAEADRNLIESVDFRLNNVLTTLTLMVDHAIATKTPLAWSDAKIAALKDYFNERSLAIMSKQPEFSASNNPDIQALGLVMAEATEQLAAISGIIIMYLRSKDLQYVASSLAYAQGKLGSVTDAVTANPAYRAYKSYIRHHDLEDTRSTFVFNPSE